MKTIFKREFNTKLGTVCIWIETSSSSFLQEKDILIFKTESFKVFVQEFQLQKDWIHNNKKTDSSIGWRIFLEKESDKKENITIYCKLVDSKNNAECNSDAGEWLDAIKIENKKDELHIGTEDGEAMLSRAEISDWMPNRFKNEISIFNPITKYIDFGFKTEVPALTKGEKLYIHFIVATKSTSDSADISTWFAVDQSKKFLDEKLSQPYS